jgi:hypothetical protein
MSGTVIVWMAARGCHLKELAAIIADPARLVVVLFRLPRRFEASFALHFHLLPAKSHDRGYVRRQ